MAWYYLPKSQQKDLAHMLNRMQNGVVLTQGPFKELDYEMASTVFRLVHSLLRTKFYFHFFSS